MAVVVGCEPGLRQLRKLEPNFADSGEYHSKFNVEGKTFPKAKEAGDLNPREHANRQLALLVPYLAILGL